MDLALQLLGESSRGKDMSSFRQTKNMLSKALKGSVDSMSCNYVLYSVVLNAAILEHYQAFAASLPHHATLLNHLSGIQSQISEARSALQEAKEGLGNRRGDLVQLWTRNQTLEEMLRILDQMCVFHWTRMEAPQHFVQ